MIIIEFLWCALRCVLPPKADHEEISTLEMWHDMFPRFLTAMNQGLISTEEFQEFVHLGETGPT